MIKTIKKILNIKSGYVPISKVYNPFGVDLRFYNLVKCKEWYKWK